VIDKLSEQLNAAVNVTNYYLTEDLKNTCISKIASLA
jgi:hypothetical protein